MQLAGHEIHQLSELTMSCFNSITNMAYFINQAQDPKLKSIIQKHLPLHIQDYNTKVEYLSKADGPTTIFQPPLLQPTLESFTQSPVSPLPPATPRVVLQNMKDREIATAYLLTLKRAGREYAWSTMETANPDLRQFLEKAFLMSSHHAYDVWQYMVEKGYYPLEPAPQDTRATLSFFFQPILQNPENQQLQ